jgi:hypothetical protein
MAWQCGEGGWYLRLLVYRQNIQVAWVTTECNDFGKMYAVVAKSLALNIIVK